MTVIVLESGAIFNVKYGWMYIFMHDRGLRKKKKIFEKRRNLGNMRELGEELPRC